MVAPLINLKYPTSADRSSRNTYKKIEEHGGSVRLMVEKEIHAGERDSMMKERASKGIQSDDGGPAGLRKNSRFLEN